MKEIFFASPTVYVFLLILHHVHLQDHSTTSRIDESTNTATSISDENASLNRYYRCLPILRVNVIARCPAEYRDEKVFRKCEKGLFPLDDEDISIVIPATGRESGIHYANQYCAQCHNDSSAELWELSISWPMVSSFSDGDQKKKTDEDILSTLRYNETLKSYTADVADAPLSCTFRPVQPDNVALVRCSPPIIWECPSAYQGAKDCRQFPEHIVCDWPNYIFGNVECARCNNFTLKSSDQCNFVVLMSNPAQTLFKLRKSSNSKACSIPAIAKYYCSGLYHKNSFT